MKKKLLLSLTMLLSSTAFAASSFDPITLTFKIDRMLMTDSPQEYRDMVIHFKDLDGIDLFEATTVPQFYGEQFYTSYIRNFVGLGKDSLLELDNTLVFKVLDDVNIPYMVANKIILFKRNDNTWFASMNNQYFNIEPFIYGYRETIECKSVSSNGRVISDGTNYWKLVNGSKLVSVGDYVTIFNDNVAIIDGQTITLEKF